MKAGDPARLDLDAYPRRIERAGERQKLSAPR